MRLRHNSPPAAAQARPLRCIRFSLPFEKTIILPTKKWGYYLGLILMRTLACLPYGIVARFGDALGAQLYKIPSKRKRVVHVNLRLCFPGRSDDEYEHLALGHFRHVIRSYAERSIQWFGSASTIDKLVQIESAIDLEEINPPPTIYMGFHFVAIEAGSMMYSLKHPVTALYTPMSSEWLDALAKRQRGRFGAEMISRVTSARRTLEKLREGKPVMLAADMDFGYKDSVFVPFFGVQTCTLTSISRLAQVSGARVVPFVTEVLPDYRGYKMTIFEPLNDYPSSHPAMDARRMNAFLEDQILRMPEQYYWVHKRFKHRPPGEMSVY